MNDCSLSEVMRKTLAMSPESWSLTAVWNISHQFLGSVTGCPDDREVFLRLQGVLTHIPPGVLGLFGSLWARWIKRSPLYLLSQRHTEFCQGQCFCCRAWCSIRRNPEPLSLLSESKSLLWGQCPLVKCDGESLWKFSSDCCNFDSKVRSKVISWK